MARRVLRTPQAADYCGFSPRTLEKLRLTGDGPPFVRLGARAIGYLVDDVDAWLTSRRCTSTSEDTGRSA